jgi:transcriptional regulator with XRE-family HTH domain
VTRPPDADDLLERVRQACPGRGLGGMSQSELAQLASVSQTTVSRILRGRWDECTDELIAQVRTALDSRDARDQGGHDAAEGRPVGPTRRRRRVRQESIVDLNALVDRDLNSTTQRDALNDLRHLLGGRPGVRISREELIGALVVVQNERLEVSVLELIRSALEIPDRRSPE